MKLKHYLGMTSLGLLAILLLCSGLINRRAFGELAPTGKEDQVAEFVTKDEVVSITSDIISENINQIKKAYDKQLINIAEEKLKLSERILSYMGIGLGIGAAIIAFLAFFGIRFGRRQIRAAIDKASKTVVTELQREYAGKIDRECRIIRQEFEDSRRELMASFSTSIGYVYWEMSRLEGGGNPQKKGKKQRKEIFLHLATTFTERALKYDPKEEDLLAQIKSNLAFYYAERGLEEKRALALEYANFAKSKFPDFHEESWLVNYGFVRMRYATTEVELDEAIIYLQHLHDTYPDLKEEVKDYLDGANRKKRELEKAKERR